MSASRVIIVIEDDVHMDRQWKFQRFEDALAELRRRANIPWDQAPNVAPCTSWRTCGREYHVIEYDASQTPWKLLRDVPVLNVSAKGADWVDGFEEAWQARGGGPR